MLKREHYLQAIRAFYETDLIKIITGIRRCGKSVILNQIRDELAVTTTNILYLNFEDRSTTAQITTVQSLLDYVTQKRSPGTCYLFLDEIQNLTGWSEACKTLRLQNCSLFITGSNSKLLSREFTKELSGRYVSFRIRPFVFKEIEAYGKLLNKEISLMDYPVYGGFPQIFTLPDTDAIRRYLNDLNDTIVINSMKKYTTKTLPSTQSAAWITAMMSHTIWKTSCTTNCYTWATPSSYTKTETMKSTS